MDAFYRENSYGQTFFSGKVFGWFTLPVTVSCDIGTIGDESDKALIASGVDITQYNYFLYITPVEPCGIGGGGVIGGNRSWSDGNLDLSVPGHELGHNFGLSHANFLYCGEKIFDPDLHGCLHDVYIENTATYLILWVARMDILTTLQKKSLGG